VYFYCGKIYYDWQEVGGKHPELERANTSSIQGLEQNIMIVKE
jgi:hypothetical protein